MKKILLAVTLILMLLPLTAEMRFKPYVLGAKDGSGLVVVLERLKNNLEANGFQILGEYSPASDKDRYIVVVSREELLTAVQKSDDLSAFAAAIRLGITFEDRKWSISYINPWYWGYAYFRDNFDEVSYELALIRESLKISMLGFEEVINEEFGSEEGLTEKKLKDYKYKIAMPKLDDTVELGVFPDHETALQTILTNLETSENTDLIYRIDIPERNLTLMGISLDGEDGESKFLPVIDISNPKHTAFLPYELLVMDNEVVMLHGRYRIAVSFPDLGMGTFMKIMSTPGNIKEAMQELTVIRK